MRTEPLTQHRFDAVARCASAFGVSLCLLAPRKTRPCVLVYLRKKLLRICEGAYGAEWEEPDASQWYKGNFIANRME